MSDRRLGTVLAESLQSPEREVILDRVFVDEEVCDLEGGLGGLAERAGPPAVPRADAQVSSRLLNWPRLQVVVT